MKGSLCFWCAVLACVAALFLLATGASLTQSRSAIAGAAPILPQASHKVLAEVVGVFIIVLALVLTFLKANSSFVRVTAWLAVAIVAADAVAGASASAASHMPGFFHSVLAQLLVSALAAVAVGLSLPAAAQIPDKGWPSLRGYATFTSVLVAIQVMLGAAFRHELMGVMSHIIGALLLALFILGLAMLVLNLPPESIPQGNPLKTPAIWLSIFAGVQLSLGLTLVSMSAKSPALTAITISHATVAALTLASTVALTILVRHHAVRVK